jgi:hypothetical protein
MASSHGAVGSMPKACGAGWRRQRSGARVEGESDAHLPGFRATISHHPVLRKNSSGERFQAVIMVQPGASAHSTYAAENLSAGSTHQPVEQSEMSVA